MRRWFVSLIAVCVVSLGCSGNDFDIAGTPNDATDGATDTGGGPADTSVATDTSVGEDSAPIPDGNASDTSTAPDTRPLDAGPPDAASITCARTGDCPANHYCKYTKCESVGVCAPYVTLPGPYFDPVCGCDGTTFWNAGHAHSQSVPIAHDGPCAPAERRPCSAPGATCDTPDSACIMQLPSASTCSDSTASGSCWRFPAGQACGSYTGPPMLTCPGACKSQCEAVKAKTFKFYPASCTTT